MVYRFIEMCQARGYTEIEVAPQVEAGPIIIDAIDASNSDASVRVMYFEIPKFNVRTAELCVDPPGVDHLIVVYKDAITCFAKRVLEMHNGIITESFPAKELESNITRHVLQPLNFRRLAPTERDSFKRKWGVNFPIMLSTDKIARYLNFTNGDVVEVHRRNGDVIYRIVK
jgi:DNA-directed RNA polymerase subunit H (RpoH/RPB5)